MPNIKTDMVESIEILMRGYKRNTGNRPVYLVVGDGEYRTLCGIWAEQCITNETLPSRVLGLIIVKCEGFVGMMVGE